MNFLGWLTFALGFAVYLTYKPYLMDIAIAGLMAISFGKVEILLSRYLENRYLIAGILTAILALLIFGPGLYFLIEASKYITSISFSDLQKVLTKAQDLINYIPIEKVREEFLSFLQPDKIAQLYNKVVPILATITAKSAVFIKDTFLIIVFFFFSILYGREILSYFLRVIPLEDEKLILLFNQTSEVMSVVFYSTILTAILEGLLFGIVISFYNLDFFLFSIMYAFSSIIPVIGGILMWGPVSLYLYSIGNTTGAIVVVLYSIVVISIVADTFVKPMIIAFVQQFFEAKARLNSLLIFFAIVAGLSSFGVWGLILGPAVTTMFVSVLKFYEKVTPPPRLNG
ncbi:MAG: AI-2E family transporter, partial [Campylobacterales bacterium]